MKNQISLKDLKSIEIDKENNCLVAIYEEEKPTLEVGKWFTSGDVTILCLNPTSSNSSYFEAVGFFCGKWAEIIEEKKPLYTNSFGTEFFEGDKYSFVVKFDNGIKTFDSLNKEVHRRENNNYTEIMSRKECYQYLADHCEE